MLYTVSDSTIWLQASNKLLRKYHIYANGRIRFPHPPESCCLKMWCHFTFVHEAPNWTVVSQTKACPAKLSCTSCAERERKACCSIVSFDSYVFWVIYYSIKTSGQTEYGYKHDLPSQCNQAKFWHQAETNGDSLCRENKYIGGPESNAPPFWASDNAKNVRF